MLILHGAIYEGYWTYNSYFDEDFKKAMKAERIKLTKHLGLCF